MNTEMTFLESNESSTGKEDRSKEMTVIEVPKNPSQLLRSSVLSSPKYTSMCLQLEMDLYTIFEQNKCNPDKGNEMVKFVNSKFTYIINQGCSGHAFAILLFSYDILSHYGAWDVDKMDGLLLKAMKMLKQDQPKNFLYFQSAVLQELCYQKMLKNKMGAATEYIQQALECIQYLEPCEWTSWVHQMNGMTFWKLAEIHRKSSKFYFEQASRAFLLCREHILKTYTQSGIHAKYCAIWALLRTAKAKLQLPWHYDSDVLTSFLNVSTVTIDDILEVDSLLKCATREMSELNDLPVYFENMSAEILELMMFSALRNVQIKETCTSCAISLAIDVMNQINSLFNQWTFPPVHLHGLKLVQNNIVEKQKVLKLYQKAQILNNRSEVACFRHKSALKCVDRLVSDLCKPSPYADSPESPM